MTSPDTAPATPRTLTYVNRANGPLLLDLYRPDQAEPVPVVIWLHGGGWFTGDRTLAPDLWRYFADAGIAMASIEYRLTGEAIFPAQLHDVRAAIRYLRTHAAELGLDPDRIGVWGASAGGHLAALAGLTGHLATLPGEDADGDASVRAVAESYGPVDLTQADVPPGAPLPGTDPRNSPEARLIGGLPDEQPYRATAASPHLQVTSAAPPFQISHGTGDVLVGHRHSELLHEALLAHGVASDLYLVDDYRHGFLNPGGRLDVDMAKVFDDGRLEAEGTAPATHRTATTEKRTRFGFDTIGAFLATHLLSTSVTALHAKESA
ncbi:alpha/beta hydrolase [Gordonia sp. CPCC 205515]|uniref:alpha/beta hydrolase fold domain-containing protein n=1 Tax=Gordonia sp. CPCC 205515 TaxID=3140791 RepID=UPI003AF3CA51